MAGIVAVAVLVVAEVVSYQYGQRKDALTEQQQTATNQHHDEEMARLHLEAT
jgi:cell division protein FtsL